MKLHYRVVIILSFSFTIMGCSAIRETSEQHMASGIYRLPDQKNQPVYATIEDDKITIYPVTKTNGSWTADTVKPSTIVMATGGAGRQRFARGSLDLDVLTILFKYRPYTAGFPNQLNTTFNGTGYLGYRSDYYIVNYEKTPAGAYQRGVSHFAFSLGFFGGVGATTMNPFVTNNGVSFEYDGVVITKGLAGLVGVGNLTFGLSIGIDHLLDKNHTTWIYQGKPWVGFSVGLNIN